MKINAKLLVSMQIHRGSLPSVKKKEFQMYSITGKILSSLIHIYVLPESIGGLILNILSKIPKKEQK